MKREVTTKINKERKNIVIKFITRKKSASYLYKKIAILGYVTRNVTGEWTFAR